MPGAQRYSSSVAACTPVPLDARPQAMPSAERLRAGRKPRAKSSVTNQLNVLLFAPTSHTSSRKCREAVISPRPRVPDQRGKSGEKSQKNGLLTPSRRQVRLHCRERLMALRMSALLRCGRAAALRAARPAPPLQQPASQRCVTRHATNEVSAPLMAAMQAKARRLRAPLARPRPPLRARRLPPRWRPPTWW